LETAKGSAAARDAVVRQKLARVYLEGELLKLVSQRAISGALHGREMGPGVEHRKLVSSEAEQHVGEAAGDVLGPDANTGPWGHDRLSMRPTRSRVERRR
jgi:alkylation response protein AidB-like acyl-CoA dehydrogenase